MGSKSSKTEKDKEATQKMEGKLKISQPSKLRSNTINRLKKLSLRNEKNISSETVPLKKNEKERTKTMNCLIKTSDIKGEKLFHLNDSFTEQFSNLNINDASTNLNKSALQKSYNNMSIDKKDFDNYQNALCFHKNIKVEECDISPNNLRTELCDIEVKIENNVKLVNSSCDSATSGEDNQNKSEDSIIERAPIRTPTNIRRHRINPLQRKFSEADETIDNIIKNLRLQEYVFDEIDRAIITEKSKVEEVRCNNIESFCSAENNAHLSSYTEFSDADAVLLQRRVASTPESECTSSDFQLNELFGKNERVENFIYNIQSYINNCQSEHSMHYSNLNHTAREKSIASKDQQTCNYEQMTKARHRLFSSEAFDKETCLEEYLKMYSQIIAGEFGTIDNEVIHNLKLTGVKKYRRTNLHAAVKDENLEKTFCIVEMHKQYHTDISARINIRDSKGKTVLDLAEENKSSTANDLLIEYLKENYADHSIHHMIPLSPSGSKSC